MKCVCLRTCQKRIDGRIVFFQRGDVGEFDECPPYFRPVAGETEEAQPLDFATAGEEELRAAKWTPEEAEAAMQALYGKSIKYEDGMKKSEVIEKILDIRYRSVNVITEPNIPPMPKE